MVSSLKSVHRRNQAVKVGKKMVYVKDKDYKGPGKYYSKGHGRMQKYSRKKDLHRTEATSKPSLPGKWAHIHDSKVIRRGRDQHKVGKV